MADPNKTGAENLAIDRDYVKQNLLDARHGDEMKHLGAAAHALQDSYSNGHAFRGDAVNNGDPTAPIESYNVFNPKPSLSMRSGGIFSGTEGTHDQRFDEVPVYDDGTLIRGSDIAAREATYRMLVAYVKSQQSNDADARTIINGAIDPLYTPAGNPDGSEVGVNKKCDDSWEHEHDRRWDMQREQIDNFWEAIFHNVDRWPEDGRTADGYPIHRFPDDGNALPQETVNAFERWPGGGHQESGGRHGPVQAHPGDEVSTWRTEGAPIHGLDDGWVDPLDPAPGFLGDDLPDPDPGLEGHDGSWADPDRDPGLLPYDPATDPGFEFLPYDPATDPGFEFLSDDPDGANYSSPDGRELHVNPSGRPDHPEDAWQSVPGPADGGLPPLEQGTDDLAAPGQEADAWQSVPADGGVAVPDLAAPGQGADDLATPGQEADAWQSVPGPNDGGPATPSQGADDWQCIPGTVDGGAEALQSTPEEDRQTLSTFSSEGQPAGQASDDWQAAPADGGGDVGPPP
jgi:hypothetical protein